MTVEKKLDSLTQQVSQLVLHVAEVRQTTFQLGRQLQDMPSDVSGLKIDMKSMRSDMESVKGDMESMKSDMEAMKSDMEAMKSDMRALDRKIDEKTEFLSGKIDHFTRTLREEMMHDRTRFDEDRYVRDVHRQEIERRLDNIESRVERLETQYS